jgi:hypothetical protein
MAISVIALCTLWKLAHFVDRNIPGTLMGALLLHRQTPEVLETSGVLFCLCSRSCYNCVRLAGRFNLG